MPEKAIAFKLPAMMNIKTADQARGLAIGWLFWTAEQSLSYGELIHYQNYFETLATKFDLTEEFKENGII